MEPKEFHKIIVEHQNIPVIPTEIGNIPLLPLNSVYAIRIGEVFKIFHILEDGIKQLEQTYKLLENG